MKKFVAGAATAGAIMAGAVGCAGPEVEPRPNTTTTVRPSTTTTEIPVKITQEMVDAHHERAVNLEEARLGTFVTELAAGTARVSYDDGNCITFALPQGDMIVKNPAKLSVTEGEAAIDFYLYTTSNENNPSIHAGPYTYYHRDLGGTSLSDAEVWPMKEVSNPELVAVTSVQADGQTSWLAGANDLRVSETVTVPYLANGQSDNDALALQASQLCDAPTVVWQD